MKFAISALLVATVVTAAPAPSPDPPGIPSGTTAYNLLAGLRIGPPTNADTYDRDLFPHWSGVSGNCNGREFVLQRDGVNVVVDGSCTAQSGTWYSPYDGATWTAASDVDIDHMSGAASWTTSDREAFANDISGPQLWAVTDNVNQQKSDQSPDEWKPPLTSFYCTYAASWIQVKSTWDLSVTEAEYSALEDMLGSC
ncbi:hypothetical protein S7711_02900 [Stachybotrys chartarum IBT 7711]|uniref:GmrSD restriction endonucleases C-terminal domain-containing protein n=1 Tax=Stachybotrys chartarum (strain CBS 109288 / IBT 7711) TaxID=1280523 RepID=A0A084AHC2_STACB|nr:hypothetical protein S7711_02900 [Stachybotrys chartarum IBT 7711]